MKEESNPVVAAPKPQPTTTPAPKKPLENSAFISKQNQNTQRSLSDLLAAARSQGASDLHIIPGQPPLIRLNGRLKHLDETAMSADEAQELLPSLLTDEEKQLLRETQALDTCCDIPGQGRYRTCIVRQGSGLDGSFRIINALVPSFQDLKLPEVLRRLTEYQQGLVLVTGPAGMGKSTTLAAMVELINQSRDEHIITLEDPIEYVFKPKKAHISQRAVGSHTQSFAAALRAALREDPDVIMVGELRDQETASLAITAAETGHLVFATLHTNSASQTIIRLLDFFPPKQQNQIRTMISESIRGVICQQLIPNQAGTGRLLALEMMFNIPAIGNLIREEKLYQLPNIIKINHKLGMKLMEESIQELLKTGEMDPNEAHNAVVEQKLFQDTQ
ncbi:PilT/PilU family type 4a pilus ATPase [candidate division KSB1 bacterium]|nr:PilT/PilU family type 4a pilus ATPase [candidate division KSB1 bacterium]